MVDVDDSRYPLVIMRVDGSDHETARSLNAALDVQLSKRQRFAVVLVVVTTSMPTASVRKIIADHAKTQEHAMKRWIAGSADVVSSKWARYAITAVHWLAPPGYPHEVFGNEEEAVQWATALLADG